MLIQQPAAYLLWKLGEMLKDELRKDEPNEEDVATIKAVMGAVRRQLRNRPRPRGPQPPGRQEAERSPPAAFPVSALPEDP